MYILIDDKRYFLNYEVNELIERAIEPLVPLCTVIEGVSIVHNDGGRNRQFFDYALIHGIIVYHSNELSLDKLVPKTVKDNFLKESQNWAYWKRLALLYYTNIEYYLRENDHRTSLHNVHLYLETAILGLVQVKTGFQTTIPNLLRLITMTRLFTDRVNLFFNKLEEDHPEQHHLLSNVDPEGVRQILDISEAGLKDLIDKSTGFLAIADELVNRQY